ncbi:hypothetical protein PFISCL1PPCAC_24732, partial [Pristionchus fissidentatus]
VSDSSRTNPARSSRNSVAASSPAAERRQSNGKCCKCLRSNLLLLLTLTAVAAGLGTGYLLKDVPMTPVTVRFIALPGEILMSMFKGIVVPLIVVSIVAGIANMNASSMGKLNGLAFAYYALITLVAVTIGLTLVMLIHPGHPDLKANSVNSKAKIPENVQFHSVIYDLIINLFPDNLFSAAFQSRKTLVTYTPHDKPINTTNGTDTNHTMDLSREMLNVMNHTKNVLDKAKNSSSFDSDFHSLNLTLRNLVEKEEGSIHRLEEKVKEIEGKKKKKEGDVKYSLVSRDGSNILGLLVYSFVFGLLISYSKEKGQFLRDLFTSLDYLIGRFVNLIIWYSPIGIFSLLLTQMLQNGDFVAMGKSLGMYVVTVLSGLFIHLLLVLFPLYIIFVRKNPIKLVGGVSQMMAVAFGTSSSVAALPLHFKCLQENMGVSKEICQMVLPVACTVNMNGTALYEAVASIFIAQLNGISLSFVDCVIVSLMSTIAALGAAVIPSAGLFTMVMILSALNVPIEDISLIMSIDWLLDRIRTTLNCLGDSVGASMLDAYARKKGLIDNWTENVTYIDEESTDDVR